MVMSHDETEGRTSITKIHSKVFERVERFRYLGTTLTYHNSTRKEIKSRLQSLNVCYHSVQNLLSCSLLT